jgi:site-specific recombinase
MAAAAWTGATYGWLNGVACGWGANAAALLRIVAGIAHHRLVQGWIAVLGHLLIDATAEHQITPQQQLEG